MKYFEKYDNFKKQLSNGEYPIVDRKELVTYTFMGAFEKSLPLIVGVSTFVAASGLMKLLEN